MGHGGTADAGRPCASDPAAAPSRRRPRTHGQPSTHTHTHTGARVPGSTPKATHAARGRGPAARRLPAAPLAAEAEARAAEAPRMAGRRAHCCSRARAPCPLPPPALELCVTRARRGRGRGAWRSAVRRGARARGIASPRLARAAFCAAPRAHARGCMRPSSAAGRPTRRRGRTQHAGDQTPGGCARRQGRRRRRRQPHGAPQQQHPAAAAPLRPPRAPAPAAPLAAAQPPAHAPDLGRDLGVRVEGAPSGEPPGARKEGAALSTPWQPGAHVRVWASGRRAAMVASHG